MMGECLKCKTRFFDNLNQPLPVPGEYVICYDCCHVMQMSKDYKLDNVEEMPKWLESKVIVFKRQHQYRLEVEMRMKDDALKNGFIRSH